MGPCSSPSLVERNKVAGIAGWAMACRIASTFIRSFSTSSFAFGFLQCQFLLAIWAVTCDWDARVNLICGYPMNLNICSYCSRLRRVGGTRWCSSSSTQDSQGCIQRGSGICDGVWEAFISTMGVVLPSFVSSNVFKISVRALERGVYSTPYPSVKTSGNGGMNRHKWPGNSRPTSPLMFWNKLNTPLFPLYIRSTRALLLMYLYQCIPAVLDGLPL